MLADRLSKALKRYLVLKELGEKVGFPRFKKPNRWHSIQLRQYGKDGYLHEDNKHLIVPGKLGKSVKIKLHRPFEGTPKTIHLVHRADGHWYALIVCAVEQEITHRSSPCDHPAIGIDVGLKSFLTDSEGNSVANPRFYRTSQKTLRRKQRQLCRRKKGSKRRKKAARNTAKTHLKISGEIVQKSLSVRTHMCPFCGYIQDRDVNAAKNILKAGALPSGVKHSDGSVSLRSRRL